MEVLKVYFAYIKIYLKQILEYRFAFYMGLIVQITTHIVTLFSMLTILNQLKYINGWTYNEFLFMYSLNLITYGIAALFFWNPMTNMTQDIRRGELDRCLVFPVRPFSHIIMKNFNHTYLGNVILSIIILVYSLIKIQFTINASKFFVLLMVIIGGTLIQASIMIFAGALSFFGINSQMFLETTVLGIRWCVNYPVNIYSDWIQVFLSFVVPYAFVNFYPAVILLHKSSIHIWIPQFEYGTFLVGISLFVISIKLWNYGINKYESAGA